MGMLAASYRLRIFLIKVIRMKCEMKAGEMDV